MTIATSYPQESRASRRPFGQLADPRLLWPLLAVVMIAPWVWTFYWPAGGGLDVAAHQIGRDFINLWAGPQLAFSGNIAVLFDVEGYRVAIGDLFGQKLPRHFWSYPLHTLPMAWPLAQLPYFVALTIFMTGSFAALAAVTLSPVERAVRPGALLLLFFAPACLINTIGGQNGFLTAALFLGGVLSIDRRPVLAGILFGLLSFKPQLGLVLPFALVALGAWRVIAGAAVTTAALLALSVALFGLEPWHQYVLVSGALHVRFLEGFAGFYTTMMVSGVAGARAFGVSFPAALALQVALAAAVLVATCWAVRATADPCRRAFVLASAAILVTPHAFNYDLTALAAVVVWHLAGPLWRERNWAESSLLFLGWSVPILTMYLNLHGLGLAPVILSGVFALSVYKVARARAARRETGPLLPAASPTSPGAPRAPLPAAANPS
jgi:Glycosyltransferase family 87